MKDIVYLGGKKIGLECLKELVTKADKYNYNLIGVATSPRGEEIEEYCQDNNIEIVGDDFPECDILISVQYHRIISQVEIDKAKEIAINLHMAPLPEYRGCNQFSYAIIDGVDTFGVTIHQINAGIDSGDIIFEDRFPIERDVWVKDLYEITYAKSIELFKNSLGNIVSGDFKRSRQEDFLPSRCSAFYKRSDIEKLKRVSLLWDKEKIERHIRATLMPGFEPPYIEIEGRKIFLSESYSNG